MKSGMKSLVEKRMAQINGRQAQLTENWSVYIDAVDKYMQNTRNRSLNLYERQVIAQCLENALDEHGLRKGKLFEATDEGDISFLGVQLPVIAAMLPTLVLNDIAIVQALDRRAASVFYFDAVYGSDKGSVSSGTNMLDAQLGHNRTAGGRRYAMAMVVGEAITDDAGTSASGTFEYAPGVKLGTVEVYDGGVLVASDRLADGVLAEENSSGVTGTITAAGAYTMDFSGATPTSGYGVTVNYQYQYDLPVDSNGNYDGVPEVDFQVVQSNLEAIDFPVRSKYSIGASIDLLKAHGINLENEVIKYLGGECKFTIDHYGIDLIADAAVNGAYTTSSTTKHDSAGQTADWTATPSDGEPWLWKKHEIMDRFEQGSNLIFAKTLRGVATYILCGNDVARVIKQLPDFKPASQPKPPTGPMNIGTLDGRTVIQDPFLTSNRYILGYRGDNFLMGSFAYCPYIPLFASPTLVTSDLYAQKGFLSSAGFKVLNPGLLAYGDITIST